MHKTLMFNVSSGLLLGSQNYLTIFPLNINEVPKKPDGFLMENTLYSGVDIPIFITGILLLLDA